MFFYNILEPRQICDSAIKFLKKDLKKASMEIGNLKQDTENGFENSLKIQELTQQSIEYQTLISELDQLGDFGTQQLRQIAESKYKKEP